MDGERVARSGAGGLRVEGRGVGGAAMSALLLGASGPLLVRVLIRPPFSVPCVCVCVRARACACVCAYSRTHAPARPQQAMLRPTWPCTDSAS